MNMLPCPFCGSKNVGVFNPGIGVDGWNTGCHECDAAGPYTDGSEQDAVDAWNRRSAFSHAEAVLEVLKDYKKNTHSYPGGNDYWAKRFEMAFENGCPCKFDPVGFLVASSTYDRCPIHGKYR